MSIEFGKLNFAVGFNRTSAFPLDANSYFESYAEAEKAIKGASEVGSSDSAYYLGQIIIVNDKTEDKTKGIALYQITGVVGNATLTKFGQATSADELGEKVTALQNSITEINGKLILATTTKDGFMSKEDKAKLDAITDALYKNKVDDVKVKLTSDGTATSVVKDKVATIDLSSYAKADSLASLGVTVDHHTSDIATLKTTVKSGVTFKGRLDAKPATTDYKNGDLIIVDSQEYILYEDKQGTKSWVELGNERDHLTQDTADERYLTIQNAGNTFLTKSDAELTYLTIEDAKTKYATTTSVSDLSSKVTTLDGKVDQGLGDLNDMILGLDLAGTDADVKTKTLSVGASETLQTIKQKSGVVTVEKQSIAIPHTAVTDWETEVTEKLATKQDKTTAMDELQTAVNSNSVGFLHTDDADSVNVVTIANDDKSIAVATQLTPDNKFNIKVATGGITSNHLASNSVNELKIVNDAVTTDKIKNGAVTTAKIANGAVTTDELDDASVSTLKIEDSAVTGAKILDGAVGTDKIANGAVTTAELGDSAVTDAKIDSCNVNKLTQTDGDILVLDGGNASGKVA